MKNTSLNTEEKSQLLTINLDTDHFESTSPYEWLHMRQTEEGIACIGILRSKEVAPSKYEVLKD